MRIMDLGTVSYKRFREEGDENGLAEILFETEWNTVTCYIDTETGEVLGLMGEGKSTDELIADDYRAVRVNATAAAVRKIA